MKVYDSSPDSQRDAARALQLAALRAHQAVNGMLTALHDLPDSEACKAAREQLYRARSAVLFGEHYAEIVQAIHETEE